MMSIKDQIFNLVFLAVLSLSMNMPSGNNIRCLDSERQALLELKDEFIDGYGRLSPWGAGENKWECCKWRGVSCDNRTNHVIGLNLRGPSQLDGKAPLQGTISPSLLELKHLAYLDLSLNDFESSSIPDFISSLNHLRYLNLSNSNFGGTVPLSVGNLSELVYLDLSYNFLFGESLDWVIHFGSLEYLDLSRVFLINETTNWLQPISKLSSIKELHWRYANLKDVLPSSLPTANASTPLAVLDLSRNHFSFSTLRWFLNFNSSLTFIDFSVNNITGPISNAFENLRSLEHLDLSRNSLEGGIPKFLGNMSSLTYLYLQHTSLTAQISELMMNLSGPLEKKLQHLDLSYNNINGSLIDFSRFSSLTRLALRHNELNGFIEKGYLNIPYLVALDLSSNNFTGAIPDLTPSPRLEVVFLNKNMFNGPLSESLGSLSTLEVLCLGSNQLEGIVTEAHFFNLSRLQFLELSSNSRLTLNCSPDWIPTFQLIAASLSGCNIGPQFPKWIQFQTKLVFLDISFNPIADNIPTWFGNQASKLAYLNVSNNQIHGFFPNITFSTDISNWDSYAQLVPGIVRGSVLDLSGNKIMGPVFFLCLTSTWRLLDLSDNLFSGRLPECFANYSSLQFLNMANNNFSGKIPHSIGSLSSLSWLDLRNNSFSGRIPSSMSSCQSLETIDLGNNRLTGEIPTWMGTQFSISLLVLSLRSNEFNGSIPSSMCSLERIQVLDLSANNIAGAIPKCLHSLAAMTKKATPFTLLYLSKMDNPNLDDAFSTYRGPLDGAYFMWKGKEVKYVNGLTLVTLIDLSNNGLAGDIPSEITELVGLVALNLSMNSLTGSIPQHIGHLSSLNFLDLSRNHLSGGIPTSIANLSFLGVLNLSYNNLSGRIPPNLNFDESPYIGNSLLCGRPILDKSCPGDYEPHRDPNSFDDGDASSDSEHEVDSIITRGFYIFMGLGFIFGFCGTIVTLIANKSIRYIFLR